MNSKSLKILIIAGVLICFITACEKVDRNKKNYMMCRQRIIEYSDTLDPKSQNYAEKLFKSMNIK